MRPYQEAKKGGFKGFLKGTFQGLTGLVIKPVAGLLDAAAQATSGLKNTVTFFDEKPNELRLRGPRVFYGIDKTYRKIDVFHTEILNVLQVLKKGKYANAAFIDSMAFIPDSKNTKDRQVIIILLEALVLLSEQKMKQIWIVPME